MAQAASNKVVIVGSGLAGMSAGVYLSEAGYTVEIFEANEFIGGRTASWNEGGMTIETGLHRFLGFYTAVPDLLEKVGINLDKMLFWEDEIEVRSPDGASAVLGLAPLHKPLKTLHAFLGQNDFLTPSDKLSIAKMFTAGAKDYTTDPLALDQISVLAYAKKHGVSKRAIHRLLIPLTEGIFFLPIAEYSMYNLMGLIMPYLKTLPKLRVGAFMGGMTEVMMNPLARYIRKHGGTIHTGMPVERLVVEQNAVLGVEIKGKAHLAEHVVLATSLYPAQKILQKDFVRQASLQDMFRLPSMPAVTFQIELDAPSMEIDRTTFGPGTVLAAFAEQSRTTFRKSKGRLSIILSPPEKFIDMQPTDILDIVLADCERLGLHIKNHVINYRKVRLPYDFYSLGMGSEHLRPPQKTDIPGLTLAGDYTKQPYLATMEGAVVSGKNAAEIIAKNS